LSLEACVLSSLYWATNSTSLCRRKTVESEKHWTLVSLVSYRHAVEVLCTVHTWPTFSCLT